MNEDFDANEEKERLELEYLRDKIQATTEKLDNLQSLYREYTGRFYRVTPEFMRIKKGA